MRRPHVMPGNIWPERQALTSRKLSALDQYSSELANFDEGGIYTLQEPLVIGGAGMELASASEIQGGIVTRPKYGNADPRIELTNQWPVFSATRTVKKTLSWQASDGLGAQPVYFRKSGAVYKTGQSSGVNVATIVAGRHLHDGATLTAITFSFRYTGQKPTSIPPGEAVGIIRYARSNDAFVALHSAGTTGGMVYTSVFATRDYGSSVETFWNGGNVLNVTYTPNQNNVIDKSLYYYGIQLTTVAETEAFGVTFTFTVDDQRFE